jgi:glycerol-3-phosphate cytidylyltransferase
VMNIKPKPKLLFMDDNSKRIHAALAQYGDTFDVTIATNVKDCLRLLARQDWAVVSLDHDLGGCDYTDPDSHESGMEVVRYLEKCYWPEGKSRPEFIIHSSNTFAGQLMMRRLEAVKTANSLPLKARHTPFICQEPKRKPFQVGLVAGAFDVIHPGYIFLLKDCKSKCDILVVAIQDDPSIDRPEKLKPVLAREQRAMIMQSIRYVDWVVFYKTEDDLLRLLEEIKPDVRFLGNEYRGRPITGADKARIVYHARHHDWSSTKFKEMIRDSFKEKGK